MASTSYNPPAEPGKIARTNVYRVIKRWELIGLAEYQKFWRDEPGWVWLTSVGLRMQGLAFTPWSPRQGTDFRHLHMLNEVRLRLEDRYLGEGLSWVSERLLKKQAGELTAAEEKKHHIPDATVEIDGRTIAIQVELTPKSYKRTKAIISQLLKDYPGIWYFVNDISEPVITHSLGNSERIKVYHLEEVVPPPA